MKNNLKLKTLKLTTYLTVFVWITTGIITVGSIYLSFIGFFINLTVGILFILIGIYLGIKEKSLYELITKICNEEQSQLCQKVILGEIILIMISLLIGLGILIAVSSRVFVEGFAVFG